MRLSLKVINDELARLKLNARLAKGVSYFYVAGDEADAWIVRTVDVRNVSTLTLKQWIDEYRRLQALNEQIMATAKPSKASAQPGKQRRT
jgi:hypothetical protein